MPGFIEVLGVFKSERKKKAPKRVSEIIIFLNVFKSKISFLRWKTPCNLCSIKYTNSQYKDCVLRRHKFKFYNKNF